MNIPRRNRDLKHYVLRNDLIKTLLFVLWVSMWCFSAYLYNDRHKTYVDARKILGWKLFFLIAAAVISGFFIFRLWTFFTNRTICGTIENADISRSYSSSGDPSMLKSLKSTKSDFHLNTVLKIRLPNGKLRRIRFVQKDGFYQYYYVGRRIVRFHGLPYPVQITDDKASGYLCAACGRIYKTRDSFCEDCHHSLIDPKDLNLP